MKYSFKYSIHAYLYNLSNNLNKLWKTTMIDFFLSLGTIINNTKICYQMVS